jgi:hypothetical protein
MLLLAGTACTPTKPQYERTRCQAQHIMIQQCWLNGTALLPTRIAAGASKGVLRSCCGC